jgi:hypothetical protein
MDKVIQEYNNVFKYSMNSPLAMLAILRQYDYLILYKEFDYLNNID